MKLYETNFTAIVDKEELTETEIKMLYKKSGKKSFKISFSILDNRKRNSTFIYIVFCVFMFTNDN